MLTREKLNDADWTVIRDTPHLVIVGISSTGGSPMDELLEHSAGMKSIVDGMNSTHPLIREIAVGVNIIEEQMGVRALNALASGAAPGDHIIDSLGLGTQLSRAAAE